MRKFDTILPTDGAEYTDHIEHRFRDRTTIDTRVSIRDSTGDFQTGMENTSHSKDDTWIIFVNPSRVGQKHNINMADQVLLISSTPRVASANGLPYAS